MVQWLAVLEIKKSDDSQALMLLWFAFLAMKTPEQWLIWLFSRLVARPNLLSFSWVMLEFFCTE